MYEPPSHVAAQRARLRRQRLVAALLAALLVAVAVAVGLALAGGGSKKPAHHGAPQVKPRAAARTGHSGAVGGVRAQPSETAVLAAAHIRSLAALGLPIFCGAPHGNAVAFTFDDGPGPYTHLALRKLAAAHEHATFFVVGRSIANFPGWVQRETALAAIGDHTYQHLYLPALSPAAIRFQIEQTRDLVQRETHRPVYFFRPPYGAVNEVVRRIVRQLGLLEILWSVDSADSLGANWAGIIRNVEAGLRPGAIILMHENRGQTIRALTTLLPVLHERHLRSVSLSELLATDPPSIAQVREGERACFGGTAKPLRGDS